MPKSRKLAAVQQETIVFLLRLKVYKLILESHVILCVF